MTCRGGFRTAALVSLLLCATFVSAQEDAVRIPRNALIVPWTRFSIQYTVRDIGNTGPKSVEFYMTTDMGKSWTRYGEDPDAKSPMVVTVDGDGVYGFMTVGTDHVGNRERAPVSGTPPETVIVVDRTPPTAKWILPAKTQLLDGGSINLKWTSSDKHPTQQPVGIEYSTDGGQSWFPLKERLPAQGEYSWRPNPALGAALTFRLSVRDRAGNRLLLACPNRVLMDNTPPTAGITGPTASRDMAVNLTYVANDKESDISRVTLYTTGDGGATWRRFGDDPDRVSPMRFTTDVVGPVGLFLVATDRAGNVSPLPRAGQEPPFSILFDNESPMVQFDPQLPEGERDLRGGTQYSIRWTASDENIQASSARLEFSDNAGDTWEPVASNLPVNAPYVWTTPTDVNRRDCMLRVSVSDTLGNVGSATTLQFSLDSVVPETGITDVRPIPDEDTGGVTEEGTDETPDADTLARADLTPPVATHPITEEDGGTVPDLGGVPSFDPDDLIVPAPTDTTPADDGPAPVTDNTPPLPEDDPLVVDGATDIDIPGTPDGTGGIGETPGTIEVIEVPDPPVTDTGEAPWTGGAGETTDPTPIGRTDPGGDIPPPPGPTASPAADELVREAEELFRDGKSQQVLELADEALKLNPDLATAHDLKARVFYTLGQYEMSTESASRAVKFNPREAAHWNNLGEASYSLARELSKQIIMERRTGDATAEHILGLSRRRDGAIANARAAFGEVITLEPDQKKGYNRLGDTIYMQARLLTDVDTELSASAYAEAVKAYTRGHRMGEPSYRETFQLGVSHYRLYDLTKDEDALRQAQRYLERSMAEAPADVQPKEAWWYLAEIHLAKKEHADSLRYWQKVLDGYPQGSKFHTEAERRIEYLKQISP